MMRGKLVRRLMGKPKGSKKDFLHSSVYAKAQNKDGIGVASTETFQQRQAMERNRTTVRGYRDSLVAEQRLKRPGEDDGQDRKNGGAVDAVGATSDFGLSRAKSTGTANLTEMAKQRAERSARFVPKNGGTGANSAAMRRFPGVK